MTFECVCVCSRAAKFGCLFNVNSDQTFSPRLINKPLRSGPAEVPRVILKALTHFTNQIFIDHLQ